MVFFHAKRSVECVAFEIVSAGETEEGGVHVAQHLHQVDAIAVGTVIESRREKGDEVEPEGSFAGCGNDEAGLCRWVDFGCGEGQVVFLPLSIDCRN